MQRLQQESRMMLCNNSDFRPSLDGPGGQQGAAMHPASPARVARPSSDGANLGVSNLMPAMLGSGSMHDHPLGAQWHSGVEQRRLSQGGGDSAMAGVGVGVGTLLYSLPYTLLCSVSIALSQYFAHVMRTDETVDAKS